MSGADLRGADLCEAKVSGAILQNVDLTGARMDADELESTDCDGAILDGLNTAVICEVQTEATRWVSWGAHACSVTAVQ